MTALADAREKAQEDASQNAAPPLPDAPEHAAARRIGGPGAVLQDLGRGRLYLLGLLGALKALGLVLVATAVAQGIASLAAHGGGWRGALAIGLLGALVRAAAGWALQTAAARTAAGVKEALRGRLLRRAVRAPGGSVGATTTLATTGLDELDQYYTVFLPALVSAATVPLLVGLRILAADWVSALIVVVTVPLIPVFMVLIGVRTRETVAQATTALARLSDHLVELARGLPVLVGLGRVREQTQALRDISEDHRRRSMATLRTAFQSALALELISTISVALVAVFVGVRLVYGTMGLEAGLIALVLAPECFAPFRDIGAAFHASENGVEARARAEAALAEPAPGAPGRDADARVCVRLASADGSLEVADLSVGYAGREGRAVEALSFTAPPGSLTVLDGPSGAGKTTVLELLAGRGALLEPEALVRGRIRSAQDVAWLPQHPHATAPSAVEELVLYGATEDSAAAILARLGLAGLATAAPARLSPGELRRLAFGRVLARVAGGAALVLLDEPTAHLDAASAALLRAEIAALAGRTTVVLASHDPELRALASRRVALPGAQDALPASAAEAVVDGSSAHVPARAHAQQETPSAAPEPGRSALRELRAVLRPVGGKVALAAFTGSAASLFAAALTAISGWLIVRASEHPHILYLEVAIVGVRFFGVGRAALRYSERLLTHDAVFGALTGLRLRLWKGLAAQGPSGRTALTPANTLGRLIGDADTVRDLAPRVVIPPLAGLVTVVAAVVALWVLYLPAGLVALGMALLAVVGGSALAIGADAHASRERDAQRSALVHGTATLLAARDDLDGNGIVAVELARMDRIGSDAAQAARRSAWALGAGSALVIAACCAAAALMLAISAPRTIAGPLPIPLAAVFVFAPLALIDPVLELVAAVQKWPMLRQTLLRIARVTAAGDAAEAASALPGEPVDAVRGLRLEDVSYRYPQASAEALARVSASVEAGEWLVVTGPSGSGKSTLLGVLLRYLTPASGRYLVDRAAGPGEASALADASALDPDALRARVAWCPQEGHLFASTLRGNLSIARSRADAPSEQELAAALERVGLGPLLAELPLGLDTPLGAEGSQLSGGQRQRVAVARTLLARSDAVLLDEPTAQLDEASARSLMSDLRAALVDRTAVLVTHHAVGVRPQDRRLALSAADAPANVGGRS